MAQNYSHKCSIYSGLGVLSKEVELLYKYKIILTMLSRICIEFDQDIVSNVIVWQQINKLSN